MAFGMDFLKIALHGSSVFFCLCSFFAYSYIILYFYTLPKRIFAYRDHRHCTQPTIQQIVMVAAFLLIITGFCAFPIIKAESFVFFVFALGIVLLYAYKAKFSRILIAIGFGIILFLMPFNYSIEPTSQEALILFCATIIPGQLVIFFLLILGVLYFLCFVCLKLRFILSKNKEKLEKFTTRYLISLALKVYIYFMVGSLWIIYKAIQPDFANTQAIDHILPLLPTIATALLYRLHKIQVLEDIRHCVQGDIIKFSLIVLFLCSSLAYSVKPYTEALGAILH